MLFRLFTISAIACHVLGSAAAVLPKEEGSKCSPVCCDHIGNVPFKSLNSICVNPNNWDGLACGFGQTRACCMKMASPKEKKVVGGKCKKI